MFPHSFLLDVRWLCGRCCFDPLLNWVSVCRSLFADPQDQLMVTTPVSGGMGMHLLQKMGWRPGEGLGKDKTGQLQPLLLEVKLDKKGLLAHEEVSDII